LGFRGTVRKVSNLPSIHSFFIARHPLSSLHFSPLSAAIPTMRVLNTLPTLVLLLATGAFAQDESSAGVSSSPAPTVSEAPTSITSTVSSTASSSGLPDSDLDPATRCRQNEIVAGPFCSPKPQDVWHTDGTYYVTWDNDRWNANSTCYLTLNYLNPGSKGRVAEEFQFSNARGFFTVVSTSSLSPCQSLADCCAATQGRVASEPNTLRRRH